MDTIRDWSQYEAQVSGYTMYVQHDTYSRHRLYARGIWYDLRMPPSMIT